MTITIAHLSDVHLAPLRGLGPLHLNIKRGLGLGNWLLKRRKVHLRAVVDRLIDDLARQQTDHIVVSGDLTNLGLPGEHAAALTWLQGIGPPERVTVVPGNHDVYCPLWRDPGVERWRAYMTSDEAGSLFARPVERGFPFVRVLGGNVALVGLVSAVPTRPFSAVGELGQPQLDALGPLLDRLAAAALVRIVVIHHPPLPGQADARRGLLDAAALQTVLERHGAELVLHGHNHVDMHAIRIWTGGPVHSLGVASASVGRACRHEPLGRYNLIRVTGDATRARSSVAFDIEARGIEQPDGPVVRLGHRRLELMSPSTNGPLVTRDVALEPSPAKS